jgi:drug/metabolite transporter (DMT)-like permease
MSGRFGTFALFLVVVFGFGSAFALNNIAVAERSPVLVAALRALIAALATSGVALLRGLRPPADRSSLAVYFLMGILTTAVPFVAIAWGQSRIPSGLGEMLFATIPLFTLLISFTCFPERRLRPIQIVGAVVGFLGAAVSMGVSAVGEDWLGIAITLLAALSYALGSLLAQRLRRFEPQVLATAQSACGTVILFPFAFLFHRGEALSLEARELFGLAVLGVASTAAPMLAAYALIRRVGAPSASTATLFIPIVAVSIGTLALGEGLSLSLLTGLAGVVLGAFMITQT